MAVNVIIRLPATDASDLSDLVQALNSEEEVEIVHPFDGTTTAQVFIALSTTMFPYLRSWMKMRVEIRKGFVAIHNGKELRGYTAEEVEQILRLLNED